MGYLISYTCTKATPIFESPQAESPVAEYGTANLKPGASFLGRAVENDSVWIGSGIGFVPRHAAAPSFTYVVAVHTPIYEDHRFDALIAEYGQAKFYKGETFTGVKVVHGWIWVTSGIGFVPEECVQVQANVYTVQPNDNLSAIAHKFYGVPERWPDIYAVNRVIIGAAPSFIQAGQHLLIP
jgi:nucleoid-associated protein YgaU